MKDALPRIVALAGPNGAGKSTCGPAIIRATLGITEFVNADVIARGLSAFDPDRAAFAAGRIMLQRMEELSQKKESFAFETTLASRTFAPKIQELTGAGYDFHLLFVWLPSADEAIRRVRGRVKRGGHNVPEEVIRRRYDGGLLNFFQLYKPLATLWHMYDNSKSEPRLIAQGSRDVVQGIVDEGLWSDLTKRFDERGADPSRNQV